MLLLVGSLRSGGTEGQVAMLANQLAARGRIVTIGVLRDATVQQRLDPAVRLVVLGKGGATGALAAARALRTLAATHSCVLSFLDAANVVAALAASRSRVVFNVRSTGVSPGWIAAAAFRASARLAGRASAIVANSAVVRDFYRESGFAGAPFRVIPNAVDTCRFRPDRAARSRVRAALGLAGDQPLIGFFARYQAEKRFDVFLEALAQPALSGVHALLAGRGADRANPDLVRLIRTRSAQSPDPNLERRLHLLGERDDVEALVPAVDVVANASDFEGFSNGLLEAMACGVPCVATAIGANLEVLDDAGNFVDVGDPEALARALARLLADPDERLYLGRAGRRRVVERFAVGAWVDAFLDVIDAQEVAA